MRQLTCEGVPQSPFHPHLPKILQLERFCHNILDVYPALWTFARADGVEPTNNHAERTLRLAVMRVLPFFRRAADHAPMDES